MGILNKIFKSRKEKYAENIGNLFKKKEIKSERKKWEPIPPSIKRAGLKAIESFKKASIEHHRRISAEEEKTGRTQMMPTFSHTQPQMFNKKEQYKQIISQMSPAERKKERRLRAEEKKGMSEWHQKHEKKESKKQERKEERKHSQQMAKPDFTYRPRKPRSFL